MITLVNNQIGEEVGATDIQIKDNILQVSLSDGRVITLPLNKITWLQWLLEATPEQQSNWSIEPGGFAIYWDDLDDGIEIAHLLTVTTLI
ncbi:hypothetical protein MNBD_CHLOROFLEXI01-4706 [hydrothermal vent metagenome]|uniref:DUF2442 domain-containing protein n=1 Tax=hydrothermal vent metagenome TaxID=652676 RepID=A0A3B0ULY7_9ZZZZ